MGPNGSGKSTLLKLVAATLFPEAGRILVLGFDTAVEPMRVRREVSLAVAQERSFFPRLTARENLSFFAALENVPHAHRRAHIAWALEQTGLAALGERYVHQFSSGMYQRLALARALLKQPAVLLLDEPTRSADPETSVLLRRFVRTLAGGGTTVLLATHSFEEAAMLADSAVLLMGGRIVDRLRRPDVHSLRSAYACLSPAAQPASDEVWEQCLT
jgi:ABC-2 type transport system ATP-binding protein